MSFSIVIYIRMQIYKRNKNYIYAKYEFNENKINFP